MYLVSNFGRVFSFYGGKWHALKQVPDVKGYMCVWLFDTKGNRYKKKVHRLVMQAFKPIANTQKYKVHHIDCDKKNNHINNLMWCTVQEHAKIHKELRKRQKESMQYSLWNYESTPA